MEISLFYNSSLTSGCAITCFLIFLKLISNTVETSLFPITIKNKTFESILVHPGPKEVNVALATPGNPTCTKTLFIASNQLSYIKIGEREDYDKKLAISAPLQSLINEYSAEKNTKCGGPFEPSLVREGNALKEIRELR
jgi:hypothetical protein